ncbi:MarC family protein [Caulobacter sp. 17J80-11]|uniref:MarC family protein n=1 Tax=Caulobacter sp. 17J80-11 TaxID=2763502 RepID=UPI001653C4F7|nr:MarC family protein [Caulobacter sp. 17J80-11]MBC6983630.1 MarC family protein [Caulobacter sp. 17J80-11]
MQPELALFVSAFSTLLALVNPLEALSVFLGLTEAADAKARHRIARRSCFYALLLMFFFLAFGTLVLKVFGVPLSMVRMAGGLVLIKIGFQLFSGPATALAPPAAGGKPAHVSFVPMAMPIMFGPGGIATIIGMTSLARRSSSEAGAFLALAAAIVATMAVTYVCLARAEHILKRIGPQGVDAITRIIGFFVSAMGMGLLVHGALEAFHFGPAS